MNYKIVIPSHKRSDTIESKVLTMLDNYHILRSNIYIFVEQSEIETYTNALPGYNIIKGSKGIGKQRETISKYFSEGEWLVSIDDDVIDLIEHKNSLKDLNKFILDTIGKLKSKNLSLCGLYPVNNYFFCQSTTTVDLRFCIGQFKIFKNIKEVETRSYELLEDYQNTIMHYLYSGGVMRYNYITINANYNRGTGGLKEYRTLERKVIEVEDFTNEFSEFCKAKKNGFEITLKRNHRF